MAAPDFDAITAATLACHYCGETVRITTDLSGDINQAANAWLGEHLAPEVVAVEVGDDEWVAL